MNYRKLIAKIAENWPAKALSIVLALILFFFHRMNTLAERFFSVPLIIESHTNLVPASPYPRMIRVTLRGEANSIYPIVEDDIQAYIDLSRFDRPGSYQTAVQIRKLGTALDVSPLEIRIDPGEINLTLDHRISKFVPLAANIRGEVDPGYVFNSYTLNPAQVIIDGPSRLVGNIMELNTEAIDLGGRSQNFSMSVNIVNNDPLLSIRGSGITEFQGTVSRVVSVRNISRVPISITGLSGQFDYEPEIRTVTLHLESRNQSDLDNFVLPDDFLVVDCSAIQEPGTYMLQVRSGAVPNLIFTVDPPEIMVQIHQREDSADG